MPRNGDDVVASGSRSWITRWDESVSTLSVLLIAGDLAVLAGVAVVGSFGRGATLASCVALLVCRGAARLYRPRLRLAYLDDLPRVVAAAGAGFLITAGVLVVLGGGGVAVASVAGMVLLVTLLGEVPRAAALGLARRARRRFRRGERTLVLADATLGADLVATMAAHPEFGLRPVARLEDAGPGAGGQAELAATVRQCDVHTVVVAAQTREDSITGTVMAAHALGCTVLVLPPLYELFDDRPNVERLRSYPLIRMSGDPTRRASWKVKRLLDVVVAVLVLVLLAPLGALIALAVLAESGAPVLFAQSRVGRHGREFRLLKFRTLRPADEREGDTRWSVEGDERIGRVGRLLRRTSLDELPQMINILRGEMSLVGPRPERPAFAEVFAATHDRYDARHRVPAGLTGLAQISGLRGDTSIADRARYDNYYIASWSLWLDLRIVLLTAGELIRHAR